MANRRDPHEADLLLPKLRPEASSSLPSTPSYQQHRVFTIAELQGVDSADTSVGGAPPKPRFESLDYEECENTVYRSDRAASATMDSLLLATSKWVVSFLIGVITGVTAFVVNLSVENVSAFKFWATLTLLDRRGPLWGLASFAVYSSMNAALVLLAVGITLFVGPAAAGSGITDVKAYLNGIDVPGIFYFSTLLAKVVGAVGAVAGGLATGKEGPFVHAGACIAALISQGGSPGCQLRLMSNFWNDQDRADFVTAGSAAGVAAAFRSPVGGVLFALEEMSSWWRNQLMWMIFFTTAVVSVTVRVLMKMCAGEHCGFFGSGGFIYFEIREGQEAYEVYELVPMLLLGVVGGLLGSSFIALNAKLAVWRKAHLAPHGIKGRLLEGLAISFLTSAVSFLLPLVFACQTCPPGETELCPRRDNSHSGNFVSFGCSATNQYNDLATLFFNTQDDAIRALFSSRTKREYTVPALVLFVSAFYALSVLTYGVFCPTGLFVPSILCGAAYGRLVGMFVADMHPGQHIDEGTYALLGAASFLGGSMRVTMCTCVMLLELTDNLALLPLIMLVLLVAKAVGDGTGIQPIYENQMDYKGLPFLHPSPEPVMRHITVKECCGRPPVTLQRVEQVSHLVQVLRGCTHNGFPVMHTGVDGDTALVGVMLRQHLLLLLNARNAFQAAPYVTENASRVATQFNVADFSKPISSAGMSIEDVKLTTEELAQYLDLGPYLNPSYFVVQDDATLSKAYTLFRTLGLRHLCVVPRAREVVGIISREDLLSGTIDRRIQHTAGQYDTDGTLASTTVRKRRSGSTARRTATRLGSRGRVALSVAAAPPVRGAGGNGAMTDGLAGSSSGGGALSDGLPRQGSLEPSPFSRMGRVANAIGLTRLSAGPRVAQARERSGDRTPQDGGLGGATSNAAVARGGATNAMLAPIRTRARPDVVGSGGAGAAGSAALAASGAGAGGGNQSGAPVPQLQPLASDGGGALALNAQPETRRFRRFRQGSRGGAGGVKDGPTD